MFEFDKMYVVPLDMLIVESICFCDREEGMKMEYSCVFEKER